MDDANGPLASSTNLNDEAQEVLHALFSSDSSSEEAGEDEVEQSVPLPIPDRETTSANLTRIQTMLTALVQTHRDNLLAALQSPANTPSKKKADEAATQAEASQKRRWSRT